METFKSKLLNPQSIMETFNQIKSIFTVVETMKFSVLKSVFKGLFFGVLLSVAATAIMFYWGETGVCKYLFGLIFFGFCCIIFSAHQIIGNFGKTIDNAYDSFINTTCDTISQTSNQFQKGIGNAPKEAFDNIKQTLIDHSTPLLKPLISNVNYEQIAQFLPIESATNSAQNFLASNLDENKLSTIKAFAESIKRYWQSPVNSIKRACLLCAGGLSFFVLLVRVIF